MGYFFPSIIVSRVCRLVIGFVHVVSAKQSEYKTQLEHHQDRVAFRPWGPHSHTGKLHDENVQPTSRRVRQLGHFVLAWRGNPSLLLGGAAGKPQLENCTHVGSAAAVRP